MKKWIIVVASVVGGWLVGTLAAVSLQIAGLDLPAATATTYSQYSTYSGAMILVLSIFFGWAIYQVLANRFLDRQKDDRPFLERAPSWARHPSVVGLIVAWVVAVFTVVFYPVAIYMSWRLFIERRGGASKVCPRCAERIKAAAMVCKHCGQEFDPGISQPVSPSPA